MIPKGMPLDLVGARTVSPAPELLADWVWKTVTTDARGWRDGGWVTCGMGVVTDAMGVVEVDGCGSNSGMRWCRFGEERRLLGG